jgi:hypothetical protein
LSVQQGGRQLRFVATLLALSLIFTFGYCSAYVFRRHDLRSAPVATTQPGRVKAVAGRPEIPGRWAPMKQSAQDAQRRAAAIRQLESVGYLGGYKPRPNVTGVTTHDRERAYPGLNLYTSGHATKAFLMSMDGTILHEWSYDFRKVWPDYERRLDVHALATTSANTDYWRRVHLYPNGDLLAIHEGIGMIKLDKSSQLQWAYGGRCHHDLFVADDGTIYVLTRKGHVVERIHQEQPILEDFITLLRPDGTVRRHVSILGCFENSPYSSALDGMKPWGDIFHTNTLEVLDGRLADRSPAFAAGNVLISLRELNLIAIVDMDAEAVAYVLSGMWVKQHDPTIVEHGRMLLFDNLGNNGRSKVMEFDPFSQEVAWVYGLAPSEELFSELCGACQRLPNGNTLITETDNGRAIEVSPGNDIVWEFVNPERAGRDGELIATIPEVLRVSDPERLAWLDGR